mgnify:CR=1 FL=1
MQEKKARFRQYTTKKTVESIERKMLDLTGKSRQEKRSRLDSYVFRGQERKTIERGKLTPGVAGRLQSGVRF